MKYFLNSDTNQVHAFPNDGTQDEFITQTMILMDSEQIDRHLNHEKYLSEAEKYELYLKRMKPLERRQFKVAALEADFIDQLEDAIDSIQDKKLKRRISIEYNEADTLHRTSDVVAYMLFELLGFTEEQVNDFWTKAAAL